MHRLAKVLSILLLFLANRLSAFTRITRTMPTTRNKASKSRAKKETVVPDAEETTTDVSEDAVKLEDNFPSPAGGRNAIAMAKKYQHKRSRSINRATIPLLGLKSPPQKIPKSESTNEKSNRRRATRPKQPYLIRPMKMKDISSVYHLGNSIFTASEFPNMYRTWDSFAVVENYEGSSEFCFVVETVPKVGSGDSQEGCELIGFLLGETVTKAAVGTRGYIQWVAVCPSYRRQGIATNLIQRFIQVAQEEEVSLLLADTPADNEPAILMFKKAGLHHKIDHVYLTCQMRDIQLKHADEDDMSFRFSYTAKGHRITIRNMEIDDLHPIHMIGEQIFTKKSANLYNFWDEHLVLSSYLSDPEFAITATVKDQDEEKVIGFAFGTTIEKPRSSWKYGYLVWLGCSPAYQGIGLAKQIYDVMLELFSLEKVRMVMIDTQQNNEGALRFFRKMGFGHDEEHVYLCNSAMDDK